MRRGPSPQLAGIVEDLDEAALRLYVHAPINNVPDQAVGNVGTRLNGPGDGKFLSAAGVSHLPQHALEADPCDLSVDTVHARSDEPKQEKPAGVPAEPGQLPTQSALGVPVVEAPQFSRGGASGIRSNVLCMIVLLTIICLLSMADTSHSNPKQSTSGGDRTLRDSLENHVSTLAGDIGERNIWHARELDAAARYIERSLSEMGYKVLRQEFDVRGVTVANVEAELTGSANPDKIIVVGGHYDSVQGCPGANDNATGVASLLEIARLLVNTDPSHTIRFVAFVNEEPPFFQTRDMGSQRYAARSRERSEKITAMFSLETMGYYSDEPGSQQYPFPLNFFHPNTANFVGFVGNVSSRRLVSRAVKAFRKHSDFPAESTAAPGWISGIGWSDHRAFWEEGYPAIMVTDTALFRYAHYHTLSDTPDKIDYDSLARVTRGLALVVSEMAGGTLR